MGESETENYVHYDIDATSIDYVAKQRHCWHMFVCVHPVYQLIKRIAIKLNVFRYDPYSSITD